MNKLVSEHNFKKVVTYTTRPIRDGEIQDVTYHFISDEEFSEKIKQDFFTEWKEYKTVDGKWRYGSKIDVFFDTKSQNIVILAPKVGDKVLKIANERAISFYVYANRKTLEKRLKKRGDDLAEIKRRLETDDVDFKGFEEKVDKIIYNNDGTNIDDVVEKILKHVEASTF